VCEYSNNVNTTLSKNTQIDEKHVLTMKCKALF